MRKVIIKTFTSTAGRKSVLLCWPQERGDLGFLHVKARFPKAPSSTEYYLYPFPAPRFHALRVMQAAKEKQRIRKATA